MPFFKHDGLRFHYFDAGAGVPFIFQHGLGGDTGQPSGLFQPFPGFRLLAFDCRGHGETRPLGNLKKIGIASFADDLLAFMDHLGLKKAIVGGISMGAAVVLNFTLRFPDRVLGLVLSRPAWLDQPLPQHLEVYPRIAGLIRRHGASKGLVLFKQSEDYALMKRLSPDTADSLVKQFEHPRAEEAVERLERIPRDAPNRDRREWVHIQAPTLVLANRHDPIHLFEYGRTLADSIPGAEFQELTSKSVSKEQHALDTQKHIENFLARHFPQTTHERTPAC